MSKAKKVGGKSTVPPVSVPRRAMKIREGGRVVVKDPAKAKSTAAADKIEED